MKDLESQLQKETARAELAERKNGDLQEEQRAACDLVRSKDQLLELGLAEICQLKESLAQQSSRWELFSFNLGLLLSRSHNGFVFRLF